jgi:hypothetical protein
LDVTLTEHSFEGVNHSSSSGVSLPSSNSLKIDSEKSLAIGEPFWNACMKDKNRYLLEKKILLSGYWGASLPSSSGVF